MVSRIPSRTELLEWVRHNAPDLRIGKALTEEGKRVCFARFTWSGSTYELEATGPEPDDEIALAAANALRGAMRLAPVGTDGRRRALERDIVAASFAGDTAHADALAHELVLDRAGTPQALSATTTFSKRVTW